MKKTLLTLFTTIAVCGMSYSQVYAQIDVSVFENKADYDVDMDDFDDTGEISFVGGDNMPSGTVIGNPDGDSGYISGELDIANTDFISSIDRRYKCIKICISYNLCCFVMTYIF